MPTGSGLPINRSDRGVDRGNADSGVSRPASPTYGIPEAPIDSLTYGRSNGIWTPINDNIVAYNSTPGPNAGSGAAGSSAQYARGDHVHPAVAVADVQGLQSALDGQTLTVQGYATAAAASASTASSASTLAVAAWDSFRTIYYGPLSADPATDPMGLSPQNGDFYFNTTSGMLRLRKAGVWQDAVFDISGSAGVTQFNGRTGSVSLLGSDVTGALTYTPANRAGDTFTGAITINGGAGLSNAFRITTGGSYTDFSVSNTANNPVGISLYGANVNPAFNIAYEFAGVPRFILGQWSNYGYLAGGALSIFANRNINIGPSTGDPGFLLRVEGTARFTNKVTFAGSTSSVVAFNIPNGTAPSSPAQGDMWRETDSVKIQTESGLRTYWHNGNLTNLNQLTNGPGYISNVVTALGFTPANKAGDTFTGYVQSGDGSAGEKTIRLHNSAVYGYFFLSPSGDLGFYDGTNVKVRFSTNTSGDFTVNGAIVSTSDGGSRFTNWLKLANSANTMGAHLRADPSTGTFQVWNNAFSAQMMVCDQSGNFTAIGNVTAYSDARLKTRIRPYKTDLSKVSRTVGPVKYEVKATGVESVGVLAQDLQKVLPECVHTNEDGILSVDYGKAALILVLQLLEEYRGASR